MTTLVLGSNAFSGQDLIDLLLDDPDERVIGVSRAPARPPLFLRFSERSPADLAWYRFAQLDMNRDMAALLELLEEEKPARIVNFAAQSEVAPSWDNPDQWFETNTVALAKLVKRLSTVDWLERYLHISSPEAFGTCVGTVTEETPDNPSTPYAASKAAADMLLKVFHDHGGLPLLTVRATNVYGARQQLFKIIPKTAISIRRGTKVPLHGGGVAVKSYIHIRDVSRAELAVLTSGVVGERYNISPDAGVRVRDVVATIAARSGRALDEVADVVEERRGQDAAYVIDSSKLRSATGWHPTIDLDQGLGEVVDWVDRHWDELRDAPLEYEHRA